MAWVRERSAGGPLDPDLRVTMHFHPDRLVRGVPILESLRRDGVYRSQFETGVGNGGLTAHPGGDRWRWESRMFGTAYDREPPSARPKYGSLNHRRRRHGGSPRFGSSFLRLTAEALRRTTFCYPDSYLDPVHFGVYDRCDLGARADADEQDRLDDYIEAHVHGPLRLNCDVEALVLDPSYRGTEVEAAAEELPCPVEWHPGYRLTAAELAAHADYRGPEVVACGLDLIRDEGLTARTTDLVRGEDPTARTTDPTARTTDPTARTTDLTARTTGLTALMIGDAARAGRYDGQVLKRLWHCLARFGCEQHGAERRGSGGLKNHFEGH